MTNHDALERASCQPPGSWRNFHVYYSAVDRILSECICPFLLNSAQGLENAFFERHYAGGSHIRVRFKGKDGALSRVAREFHGQVERFLAAHPSVPSATYSPERAREMMEAEGQPEDDCGLEYRVNTIVETPYQRLTNPILPDGLTRLLEAFLQDSTPLIASILHSARPKAEEALRIYFVQAALVSGNVRGGAVAYRAHWEGFAGLLPNRKLIERIRDNYARQKEIAGVLLRDALERRTNQLEDDDPVTAGWSKLIRSYDLRVTRSLSAGDNLGFTSPDEDQLRDNISTVKQKVLEPSVFFDRLLGDTRFFLEFGRDPLLLRVRVLINLLYCLIANLGLTLIDRMSLCYFAYRAVEDHYQCNLEKQLDRTIRAFVR